MSLRLPPFRALVLTLWLGSSLSGAPAYAAETPAGELAGLSLDSLLDMPVTGASRFVQRRSQASSAVTVITREELVAFGHRTLSDALRSIRGVAVATDRTYDYLGVRGFLASGDYNTRVLLLVDGNRVNDAVYDQAFVGTEFPLDLDLVERIEFVPGQGSAVYGANALFGVVNIITREAPRRRQADVGLALGAAGERAAHAALRLPWGNGGLQVQASRRLRRGEALFDAMQVGVNGSDGWTRDTDFERRSAVFLRLDQGGFTASLVHADRLKGTPMAVDLVYGDARNRYRDTYSLLNLEQALALSPDTRLTARGFAGRYRFVGDYVIDYPPPTLNRDDVLGSWRGVEARVSHDSRAGHRVVAGVELQDVPELVQRNYDLDPAATTYLDDTRRSGRAALYAEDQWSLSPAWELHLGARADRVRSHDWQLSPRIALVWAADAEWSFKLIQGSAFRQPNAYEAFYAVDAPAGYVVNPALRAERVRGTELVAEWRPRLDWRLSGSLYANHARRLLLLGYDAAADRYQFDNAAEVDTEGGELEAEYAQSGTRWRANYSWARTQGSGATLSYFPRQMLKGTAMWPLGADWTLALEALAISRRGDAPGYGLAHLTLHGPAWDGGPELTVAVRNLADRQASDPGADPARQPVVPLPGRQWRVEARWPLPF